MIYSYTFLIFNIGHVSIYGEYWRYIKNPVDKPVYLFVVKFIQLLHASEWLANAAKLTYFLKPDVPTRRPLFSKQRRLAHLFPEVVRLFILINLKETLIDPWLYVILLIEILVYSWISCRQSLVHLMFLFLFFFFGGGVTLEVLHYVKYLLDFKIAEKWTNNKWVLNLFILQSLCTKIQTLNILVINMQTYKWIEDSIYS